MSVTPRSGHVNRRSSLVPSRPVVVTEILVDGAATPVSNRGTGIGFFSTCIHIASCSPVTGAPCYPNEFRVSGNHMSWQPRLTHHTLTWHFLTLVISNAIEELK